MPFKFGPMRGNHNTQMSSRGDDPLVVLSGDDEDLMSVLGAGWSVTSVHNNDWCGVRYSVLEYLLAPALAVATDTRGQLVLRHLIDPARLLSAWREFVAGGFDTSKTMELDSLCEAVSTWAIGAGATAARTLSAAAGDLVTVADPATAILGPGVCDWVVNLSFGDLAQAGAVMGRRAMLLGFLGPRNLLASRSAGSEMQETGGLVLREFDADNPDSISVGAVWEQT